MSIRNLERMLKWGDKIGALSLFICIGSAIMTGVFALCFLADSTAPDVWETATWFFYTAVASLFILLPCIGIVFYAQVLLEKFRPRYTYGVNWKRDGF